MLSCMIGPPSGLNLRNILWHGFASPAEISQESVIYIYSIQPCVIIKFLSQRNYFTLGMHISCLSLFQALARCFSLLLLPSSSITDPSSLFTKIHNLPISLLVNLSCHGVLYTHYYNILLWSPCYARRTW